VASDSEEEIWINPDGVRSLASKVREIAGDLRNLKTQVDDVRDIWSTVLSPAMQQGTDTVRFRLEDFGANLAKQATNFETDATSMKEFADTIDDVDGDSGTQYADATDSLGDVKYTF
jgi:methyl-accepting chemotaxis protein